MKTVRLVITTGDPAGVGPQVVARSLDDLVGLKGLDIVVCGHARVLQRAGLRARSFIRIEEPLSEFQARKQSFHPGCASSESARASFLYLNRAVELLRTGEADALVTGPVSKENLRSAGFRWPGHTEFLAQAFGAGRVQMVFVSDRMKVLVVTRHVSLREGIRLVKRGPLVEEGVMIFGILKSVFGIRNPRIVVCGLNPHAGESGLFGREEITEISPAVKILNRRLGEHFTGPLACDTVFYRVLQGEFDLVMAMYHDQGLIPFKTLSFDTGVNLTAGLPFIRTSPVHGTAFDIARNRNVRYDSMKQAILLAYRLAKEQKKGSCACAHAARRHFILRGLKPRPKGARMNGEPLSYSTEGNPGSAAQRRSPGGFHRHE